MVVVMWCGVVKVCRRDSAWYLNGEVETLMLGIAEADRQAGQKDMLHTIVGG